METNGMRASEVLKYKVAPLVVSYLKGNPIYCCWQVTNRCNLRCNFCNYPQDAADITGELSGHQFATASASLREIGPFLVSLAGGEPFLRTDIAEIVQGLAQYHLVVVTTNGWLVNASNARAVFEAGAMGVNVSVDYADPDKHDGQRGIPGAHSRALAALRTLVRCKKHSFQQVSLICVLMHDNIDQIETLIVTAKGMGANVVVQPYCHLKTKRRDNTSRVPVSKFLLRLKKKYPNFASSEYFLKHFDRYLLEGQIPNCHAGRTFFNIDGYGNVAHCVEARNWPVGNILIDAPFYLQKKPAEASANNRCGQCWYSCRGEVDNLYSLNGFAQRLTTLLYQCLVPGNKPNPLPS